MPAWSSTPRGPKRGGGQAWEDKYALCQCPRAPTGMSPAPPSLPLKPCPPSAAQLTATPERLTVGGSGRNAMSGRGVSREGRVRECGVSGVPRDEMESDCHVSPRDLPNFFLTKNLPTPLSSNLLPGPPPHSPRAPSPSAGRHPPTPVRTRAARRRTSAPLTPLPGFPPVRCRVGDKGGRDCHLACRVGGAAPPATRSRGPRA